MGVVTSARWEALDAHGFCVFAPQPQLHLVQGDYVAAAGDNAVFVVDTATLED